MQPILEWLYVFMEQGKEALGKKKPEKDKQVMPADEREQESEWVTERERERERER